MRTARMGTGRLGLWFGLLEVDLGEPRRSDLGALRQGKRVLYVDAEVSSRALNLRVPEQDLNGPVVSSLPGDDGRLGPPQRVRPEILPTQSNVGDPLVHEPRILPGTDVSSLANAARKGEVVERAAPTLKPSKCSRGQVQEARPERVGQSYAGRRWPGSEPARH